MRFSDKKSLTGILSTVVILFLMAMMAVGNSLTPALAAAGGNYAVTFKQGTSAIQNTTVQFVPAEGTVLDNISESNKKSVKIDDKDVVVLETSTDTSGKAVFPGITEYLGVNTNTSISGYYRIVDDSSEVFCLEETTINQSDKDKTDGKVTIALLTELEKIKGYAGDYDAVEHDLITFDTGFLSNYICTYREKGTSGNFIPDMPKGTNVLKQTYEIKVADTNNSFAPTIIERTAEIKAGALTLKFVDDNGNEISNLEKIWFNDDFIVQAKGTPYIPDNEIEYSSGNEDVATVNGNKVTLNKAGTAKITATYTGSNYSPVTAELTLTVKKATAADVGLSYATASTEPIYNASGTFKPELTYSTGINTKLKDKAASLLTYNNGSADGTITYSNPEEAIKITAKIDGSGYGDYFDNGITAEYSGTVKALNPGDAKASVNKTLGSDNVVYVKDNYVCYKTNYTVTAPVTYTIAEYKDRVPLKDLTFENSLTLTESKPSGLVYVLKNDQGQITSPITTDEKLVIDTAAPQIKNSANPAQTFKFDVTGTSPMEKVFHFLSFGTFCKEKIKVTVFVEDESPTSTINEITLIRKDETGKIVKKDSKEPTEKNFDAANTNSNASAAFEIPLDFKGTIFSTAKDQADNAIADNDAVQATSSNSNVRDAAGFIMLEAKAPVVSNEFTITHTDGVNKGGGPVSVGEGADKKDFLSGNATVQFDAEDENSGLSKVEIFYNGQSLKDISGLNLAQAVTITGGDNNVYPQTFNKIDNSKYSYTVKTQYFTPDADGKMAFKVEVTDNAGNASAIQEKIVYKDVTAATVTAFEFTSQNGGNIEGNNKPVNVEITEYGYYFKENTKVIIYAEDVKSDKEAASGVKSITYKAVSAENNQVTLQGTKDVEIKENKIQINFDVEENFKGQIYAYATDKVGQSAVEFVSGDYQSAGLKLPQGYDNDGNNKAIVFEKGGTYAGYVHPLGLVVETQEMHHEKSSVSIDDINDNIGYIAEKLSGNPFEDGGIAGDKNLFDYRNNELKVYNGLNNLNFQLSVSDTYSGIKQIETKIFDGSLDTPVTDNTTVVDRNGNVDPESGWSDKEKESNLLVKSTKTINLNPSEFKEQTVFIQIILTDRAGNQSYNYYPFVIDKTTPNIDKFEIVHTNNTPIKKLLNNLTFGLFFNEELQVTVTAIDNSPSSGISNSENLDLWGEKADGTAISAVPVENGFSETKPSKENDYKTIATKKYILPLEFDGHLYAQIKDNAEKSSSTTQAVGGEDANTTVDGEALTDHQGYINLEAHVPNIFKTTAENEASLVNDKEPNGQFTNDQVKQINGVHNDETFTHIDGKDFITGDAMLSFVVQDQNSGLREVAIEVNEEKINPFAVTINNGEKAYPFDYVKQSSSVNKPFREKDHYVINTTGIAPDENGEYRIKVTVTDNAGNVSTLSKTFYKDITAATVTDFEFKPQDAGSKGGNIEGDGKPVNVEVTDYGYYFKENAKVVIFAEDVKSENEIASGVQSITYKAVSVEDNQIKYEGTKPAQIIDGRVQIDFDVESNFKGQIYAYATDKLGQSAAQVDLEQNRKAEAGQGAYPIPHLPKGYENNEKIVFDTEVGGTLKGYVHPLGLVIEKPERHRETSSIVFDKIPDNPYQVEYETTYDYQQEAQTDKRMDYEEDRTKHPIFYGDQDLQFGLTVSDTYSGIAQVEWTVLNANTKETVSSDTATVDSGETVKPPETTWKEAAAEDNLITQMTATVNVAKPQVSTEYILRVVLTDRAGNKSYDYYVFGIDKTKPEVQKYGSNDLKQTIKVKKKEQTTIEKVINFLSFGTFFKESLDVTVNVKDDAPSSGIQSITLAADDKNQKVFKSVSELAVDYVREQEIYAARAIQTFEVPLAFEGKLFVTVKDNVDLSTTKQVTSENSNMESPGGLVIIEDTAPVVEGFANNENNPEQSQIKQINGVNAGKAAKNLGTAENETLYVSGDAALTVHVQDTATDTLNGKTSGSGLNNVTIKAKDKDGVEKDLIQIAQEKNIDIHELVTITAEGEQSEALLTYPQDFIGAKAKDNRKYTYTVKTKYIDTESDGKITVSVDVRDNAQNEAKTLTQTIYKDITAATVTRFTFTPTEHIEGTTRPVNIETTDYGYYFKENANVTITAEDVKGDHEAATGVHSITYKAVSKEGKVEYEGTQNVENNQINFNIDKNFKGQIYAYAIDKLGQSAVEFVSGSYRDAGLHLPVGYDNDGNNKEIVFKADGNFKGYVHPSGSIVENSAQHYETSDIQITAPNPVGSEDHAASYSYTTQMDKELAYDASQMVPLYNGGFNFGINVGDSYSGIREITWTVIEGGTDQSKATVTVQNDGSLTGDAGGWSVNEQDENLVTRMSTTIPVSGNYNDMVLRVDLTDRSGNQSYDYYMFGIDTTAPTINVSYDNNNGDSIGAKEANHAYYNADRIATITVTERNFDPSRVNVHATSNGGAMPVGLSWSDSQAGGNGDGSTHVAQIVYSDDADYTFTMDCMDRANWTNSRIDYGGSLTPENFTVDKTLPVVTVTYDNNDAANGKYFKANRTATITVQEHNFDVSRMTTQITAMLDGQGIGVPGVSWSGEGDTHYGTVAFNTDGDYTLNVTEARDAAGNAFAGPNYSATAAQDFTVDTKIEKPVIRGVENEHAYKDDFAIGFDILDINFDTDTIQLLRTRYDKKDEDVTADFLTHISRTDKGDVADGNTIEKKQDYDGIYTLNLTVTDKATNTESATVTFSVNRFGSVYVYDSYLSSIIDGYVKKVDQGLVITEYNPDRLLQNSLQLQATRDSAPMKDLRYTVSPAISNTATVGESGWYQYRYSITADNFAKDGIYAVTVASKDEAGNQPENTNYPDKDILFRVDSVAPELVSVTGLEKDTINAIKANVEYKAFDAIALDEVSVYVNNERVDYINTFEDLTTYSGQFSIGEGVRQNIRIVLKDKAGNVMNTADADFKVSFPFERTVTVSTNPFVRWFSNIYRTVGTTAVGVVAIGVCIYLLLKKNKDKSGRDDESTK